MNSFEYTGYWWDAREPDTEWAGTLRFDPTEGALLTLTVPVDKPTFHRELQEYPVIHGTATSGEPITLLRCFDQHVSGAWHGPHRREIFAHVVVVGFHSEVDPMISVVSVAFRHLDVWWTQSAIRADLSVPMPDFAVRYTCPSAVTVRADENFDVKLVSGLSSSASRHKYILEEQIHVEIKARENARPLSEFQTIVHACQDLLTVACQTFCHVDELRLLPPEVEGEPRRLATLHAVPIYKPADERAPSPSDLLFRFADISDRAQEIIGGWLARAENLKPFRSLYLSGVYGGGFLEVKLVALAQAAEAYHRRCYDGVYMKRDEFEERVLKPLTAAIPNSLDSSFQSALRKRLHHADEYSLRKRLTLLFSEHEEALATVVSDPKRYIEPIVRHRNEFAHQPVDASEPASDHGEELLRCIFVLRFLLDMCFLKTMGFTGEEMKQFAARADTYRRIKQTFFRAEVAAEQVTRPPTSPAAAISTRSRTENDTNPNNRARTRRRTIGIVGAILALGLAIWFLPKARRWMAIDSCLDAGGRWDYSANLCDR
jgi:hypothetical protein